MPRFPDRSPLRRHWPLADDIVFLNHGSFGACPTAVLEAQSALRLEMEREPLQFLWRRHDERHDAARREVAAYVGADPANLVFVTNATTGVNAVARSIDLRSGDEILTTNLDYNACRNALLEPIQRAGAKLTLASIPFPIESEEQIIGAILAAVTPRTRLVMIDHVTSNTALVVPVERIVRELEARGIDTLIDGAHAPGMLPLNLEKLRPAYYTANLHKWTCAPKGAAFLWARPDLQETLQPAVISHGNNTPRAGHSPYQDRFDWPGTHDPTAWWSTPDAIRWLDGILPGGTEEVRQRNNALLLDARRLLCERLGLTPPCPESMLGSITTLPLPGRLGEMEGTAIPDPLYERLFETYRIEMPIIRLNGSRWFRISAHLHNSIDEYRYLADALEELQR